MTVFAPVYIDTTADTIHSATPSLCTAQLTTSLGNLMPDEIKENIKSFVKCEFLMPAAQQALLNRRHVAMTLTMTAFHVSHHCLAALCWACKDDHSLQDKISSVN